MGSYISMRRKRYIKSAIQDQQSASTTLVQGGCEKKLQETFYNFSALAQRDRLLMGHGGSNEDIQLLKQKLDLIPCGD